MPGLYIDFTAIAAIWMGGLLLLVAIVGIVIRQSGVPFVAALAEYRRLGNRSGPSSPAAERLAQLERRIARLESSSAIGPRHTPTATTRPASSLKSTAGAS